MTQTAALIAAGAFALLALAGVFALLRMARLMSESTRLIATLRERGDVLIDRAQAAVDGAQAAVDRAGRQLDRAESVTASMDELGLALLEDSFRALRKMLRQAREERPQPERLIERSVEILTGYVRENRQQFAFIARLRSTGNTVLRHAVRGEVRLLTSELATDLARFPILREWIANRCVGRAPESA